VRSASAVGPRERLRRAARPPGGRLPMVVRRADETATPCHPGAAERRGARQARRASADEPDATAVAADRRWASTVSTTAAHRTAGAAGWTGPPRGARVVPEPPAAGEPDVAALPAATEVSAQQGDARWSAASAAPRTDAIPRCAAAGSEERSVQGLSRTAAPVPPYLRPPGTRLAPPRPGLPAGRLPRTVPLRRTRPVASRHRRAQTRDLSRRSRPAPPLALRRTVRA